MFQALWSKSAASAQLRLQHKSSGPSAHKRSCPSGKPSPAKVSAYPETAFHEEKTHKCLILFSQWSIFGGRRACQPFVCPGIHSSACHNRVCLTVSGHYCKEEYVSAHPVCSHHLSSLLGWCFSFLTVSQGTSQINSCLCDFDMNFRSLVVSLLCNAG